MEHLLEKSLSLRRIREKRGKVKKVFPAKPWEKVFQVKG